jgi:hypothetical protein
MLSISISHDGNRNPVECIFLKFIQLLVEFPYQVGAQNSGFRHVFPKLDLPPQDHSSFLLLKMLRKEANKGDSILGLAVSVKHLSGHALDLFAVLNKLAYPFGRLGAPLSLKIVQRGAADTARDLSIGVKHREPKQHPVNVVSERFAPPQYHCDIFPDPTIKMLFLVVERVAA